MFEVSYDPVARTATFTNRSYDLNDLPITGVVLDGATGDLYAHQDLVRVNRFDGPFFVGSVDVDPVADFQHPWLLARACARQH